MFIDVQRIFIKAGDGGDGCTSFYTEKYVSKGGPDGGDGGKGGDIIFEADPSQSSLIAFRYSQHFKAENGARGESSYCNGKNGKDAVVKVPLGTLVKDAETGGIIADMYAPGYRVTVLKGGRGGKGNARFKTSRRQAPRFSQTGEKTLERNVILELKTIADVGLVGFPNVGKSTILSIVSAARPKIAGYHFTTLSPNLGVVRYHDFSFTVADIPGLIEGAGTGAGLGHDFLRHIDRVRLIVHVIDISGSEGRDPVEDYRIINGELKTYNKALSKVKQIVVLNKTDLLPEGSDAVERFKRETGKRPLLLSAATHDGKEKLIETVAKTLAKLPPAEPLRFEPFVYKKPDAGGFEILRDTDGAFEVAGGMMEELARNVVLDSMDSFNFFQRKLKELGVIKALRAAGAADGDTVRILDIEFEFVE